MLRIGWFSTGRGEGSRGLLRFVGERLGEFDGRIEFVFCNREWGEGEGSDAFLGLVGELGLPLVTCSSAGFRRRWRGRGGWREAFDGEVLGLLGGFRPDVCVLAGYMLVVGGGVCGAWPMLNLHPALPDGPVGTWQEVVWELIGRRAVETGAMVHLATADLDRGPVVSFVRVPLDTGELAGLWRELGDRDAGEVRAALGEGSELFRRIRAEGFRREPFLLVETLRAIGAGEVAVEGGRVVVEGGGDGWYGGLCLDGRVGRAMGAGG